jgi:hypothetical protein
MGLPEVRSEFNLRDSLYVATTVAVEIEPVSKPA